MMRLPILFLFITVMLDAMGVGLIMPIMPDLIREVEGGGLADAALWGGAMAAVFAVMQFLFSPIIGNLSDYYGRRPVLLVSLFVMTLDYLLMAVAGSMWLLMLGRIIGGITAATHATANAYVADISKPAQKAANFGLLGAGFGLGFVMGPLIGGLLGEYGTRAPFYAAAILAAMNFTLGWFVMGESVTDKIRRPFSWKRANPFGAFRSVINLPGIRPLLLVYFLYNVALYAYPAVWSYFTQERFDWTPQIIGVSLALFGISMAIVQGVLIRLVLRWFGERKTVIWGHLFDFGAFGIISVVTSGTIALILTPISALGAVVTPALQGIMSRMVDDNAQGELQGVLTSVTALAMIISPLVMTSVFAFFTREGTPYYLPGAPFMVSSVLILIGLVVFARCTIPDPDA
ncbi:MAG: TCR/Tet family MFS transporter [Mucilaginibacter sp.]|nr:TCR/Tet family MFS transporter [Mucilaginibacter sp.]